MKTIKNKWNGTKITVNYIGNLGNRFGVKKKQIILNKDKLEPLLDFNIFNNDNFKIRRKKAYYFNINKVNKVNKLNKNNENGNFKSLHLKDWEKTNNYNFYNYFINFKYFHRVNNSKRILSSTKRFNMNRNKSSIALFENELNQNENKENNYFSAKRRKKEDLMFKNFNKIKAKEKREKLSKKNISKIISQKIINYKKKIINEKKTDKINVKSLLFINKDIQNLKTNCFKKDNYIFNDNIKIFNKNNFKYKPLYLYSVNNKTFIQNINDYKNTSFNPIFNSYNLSNSQIKIEINNQNNNFINNFNFISPRKINHSAKKVATFRDASTNTDL